MAQIIGRKREIEEITELYRSDRPEFLAIYGRRRVGKTFLIKETLKGKFTFYHSGLSPIDDSGRKSSLKDQLESFYFSMVRAGLNETGRPKTWIEAFFMLETLLEDIDDGNRQVVFIDELPWMDTPKSGFLPAFESFWNEWGTGRDNLMLIVCGSATSWMLKHISDSKGGLYNRTTLEIHLSPFTLSETDEFLKAKGIQLTDYDVAEAYMILGGIPYYLNYFKKGLSLAQNIDQLLFARQPRLANEFNRLFSSLFSEKTIYKDLVRRLAKRRMGYSRTELAKALGLNSGGKLTAVLKDLCGSGFITSYKPFQGKKKETLYRLCDPFCSFHLAFVEDNYGTDSNYWTNSRNNGNVSSWRGLAFEDLCMSHVDKIKEALKIGGILSTESAFICQGDAGTKGTQIDLLINRNDHIVNLCEMKFSTSQFVIDNGYAELLQRRIDLLSSLLPSGRQSIHLTFVTTRGIKPNSYSGIVQKEVLLQDLMKP